MNGDVALFKFLYAWIIVFFHFFPSETGLFQGGYIGVEYYLLIAGIFFFRSYEKQRKTVLLTPYQWFRRRFQRLFPGAFIAFVFAIFSMRKPPATLAQALDYLSGDIWEILLVDWNGMNGGTLMLNGAAWTISAMLLAGFLIWAMLYYFEERFLHFWMPLSLLVGYGFWRHLDSAGTEVWIGFTAFGTFRAYLVMCLGWYCLQLSKHLAAIPWNRRGEILLTAAECLCQMLVFWIMLRRSSRYYQWFATLLLIVAAAISVSGKSLLCRWLSRWKGAAFLQELSLSIYLMHVGTFRLFQVWQGEDYMRPGYLPALIACILGTALIHCILTKFAAPAFAACGRIAGGFLSRKSGDG